MKTRSISGFILILLAVVAFSQQNQQKLINEQVWAPFLDAFNLQDQKSLSKVHSKAFIRVIRDGETIFGFDEAFKEPEEPSEWKRILELRFIERIASSDQAFEVGYYRTSYEHRTTQEKQVSYGKFHVLLRKEKGIWKILMDADGQLGVDESIFQSGRKMDEF